MIYIKSSFEFILQYISISFLRKYSSPVWQRKLVYFLQRILFSISWIFLSICRVNKFLNEYSGLKKDYCVELINFQYKIRIFKNIVLKCFCRTKNMKRYSDYSLFFYFFQSDLCDFSFYIMEQNENEPSQRKMQFSLSFDSDIFHWNSSTRALCYFIFHYTVVQTGLLFRNSIMNIVHPIEFLFVKPNRKINWIIVFSLTTFTYS